MCQYQRRIWFAGWENSKERRRVQRVPRHCIKFRPRPCKLWWASSFEEEAYSLRYSRDQKSQRKIRSLIQCHERVGQQILSSWAGGNREEI